MIHLILTALTLILHLLNLIHGPVCLAQYGMSRIARQLTTSYNRALTASTSPPPTEQAELALSEHCAPREMAFAAGLNDLTIYPQTLRAARSSPNSHDLWKAVCTEFDNCEAKKVWTIVKKSNVLKRWKIIGNRWGFARTDDGSYRAIGQLLKALVRSQVKTFKITMCLLFMIQHFI
jgi:hypothetical protein